MKTMQFFAENWWAAIICLLFAIGIIRGAIVLFRKPRGYYESSEILENPPNGDYQRTIPGTGFDDFVEPEPKPPEESDEEEARPEPTGPELF